MKPAIDERKCPAQIIFPAIPACIEGAILYVKDANTRLGGRIIINNERSNSYGACVDACCGTAIALI